MSEDPLREILATLKEQLKWTRFAGMKQVKEILLTTLDSDQKRRIYHHSNGETGSVEVANLAGTSDRTVRRYWNLWARLGIMEPMKVRGGERFKRIFELQEFGVEVPETAVLPESKQEIEQKTTVAYT